VNVDEHNEKAAAFGVRAIPTLVLFDQGRAAQTFVGVQPKAVLKTAIDRLAA
jgi:thioredoxin 1